MTHTIPKKALIALPDFSRYPECVLTGKFQIVTPQYAFIPAFDRSFHFGDSLYEVIRTYNGILFSLDEHLRRLEQSAKLGMYEELPDLDWITTMIRETCRCFFRTYGNTDVYIRLTISRGYSDLNIDTSLASKPYPVVIVKEFQPPSTLSYQEGMHYAVVSRHRNLPSALDPAMKSGNYLNNVLALAEARKQGAQDAVLLNYQGFVTEGTTNNIFAVKDGEVWTAPLFVGILAGITRDWIFKLCKKEGIPVHERLFTDQDLLSSQEVFLSSSLKEIMPITKLSGKAVGNGKPGPVTKKIHRAFQALVADYIKSHQAESLYV